MSVRESSGGSTRYTIRDLTLTGVVALAACCVVGAAPPEGFIQTPVVTDVSQPIAIEFASDGRLFIAERIGRVVVVSDGASIEALQLPSANHTLAEGGLLGMALHPDFVSNGWVYLFYTLVPEDKPHSRVSRFRAVGNTLDPDSEEVIWEAEFDQEGHFGGCLVFGLDGNLHVAAGENWSPQRSQELSRPEGKIFRIRDDGTIPVDNPFVNMPDARPDVWAYGFRNPFRLAIDPVNGELYAGDVGAGSWEEIDRVHAGANGGWPLMEGPQCYISDCSGFLTPIWSYGHGGPGGSGASLILGPIFRAASFPKAYRGNIFAADFVHSYIKRLILDAGGTVVDEVMFDPEQPYVSDMEVGPDGALYVARIFGAQMGIHRIEFVGTSNEPPIAVADAEPIRGEPPLTVQFHGSASHDLDDWPGPLTYLWTFDDGATSTEPDPQHTYVERGHYLARLTVHDGQVANVSEPVSIVVGRAPLVAMVMLPPAGSLFRAGDTISFAVTAFDPEDGELPAESMSWTVFIVRPGGRLNILQGPVIGEPTASFTVPTTGRTLEESHLRIELTAVDSDGISTIVTRELFPLVAPLRIDTIPSGIPVFLDEQPLQTPYVFNGPAGFQHVLRAQETAEVGDTPHEFLEWSGFEGRELSFRAPDGGAEFVAVYRIAKDDSQRENDTAPPIGLPCFLPLLGLAAALWLGAHWRGRRAA